jgi:hypothetical protein
MRGLSSNQIISIAFFLTAIFISLALTGIPALISNRDAEMPSFYQEGMSKKQRAAAAATKAAAKPPPPPTIKKTPTTKPVKCSSNQTLTNGICVAKPVPKSLGALSVKPTTGKQSASLKK